MSDLLQPPVLTRNRVRLAFAIAVTVDALQFTLGPLGWAFADEILDVAAMIRAASESVPCCIQVMRVMTTPPSTASENARRPSPRFT